MEGRASLGGRTGGPVFLLWLCLCLASALVHALIPLEAPSIRGTGSAFSASTSAVAIKPARSSVAREQRALPARKTGVGDGRADPAGNLPRTRPASMPSLPAVIPAARWPGEVPSIADGIRSSPALARAPPLS